MSKLPEGVNSENYNKIAAVLDRRIAGVLADDQFIQALIAAGMTLRQASALLRRQDRAFVPDVVPSQPVD